jgi:HSP20 family molecular chaperone IbpA
MGLNSCRTAQIFCFRTRFLGANHRSTQNHSPGLGRTHRGLATAIEPEQQESAASAPDFPEWGLLSAETWETAGALIVRMEVPGMDKDDFDVSIHGNTLRIRGEKRSEDNHHERKYHLMERAYGRFERSFALPQHIDRDKAEVSYRNGILTVILAKTEPIPPKQLPLQ